jgi:hypothetical protein
MKLTPIQREAYQKDKKEIASGKAPGNVLITQDFYSIRT